MKFHNKCFYIKEVFKARFFYIFNFKTVYNHFGRHMRFWPYVTTSDIVVWMDQSWLLMIENLNLSVKHTQKLS